jgi:hypothetical protein
MAARQRATRATSCGNGLHLFLELGEHGLLAQGPDPACAWIYSPRLPLPEGHLRDEHRVLKPRLSRSRGVPRRLASSITALETAVVNIEQLLSDANHDGGKGAEGFKVTRPTAVGAVHSCGDVPLDLHVVAQAADASSARLPLSSVEPRYGLDPHVLVGKVNPEPDHGCPAPPYRQRRSLFPLDHISLPVRLSRQHQHPHLRRSSWDGIGRSGRNA